MIRLGFAEIVLAVRKNADISFSESAEVSLDCVFCRRRARTVTFPALQAPGRCWMGHEFAGRLVKMVASGETARYEFEYEYSPFVDSKYPDERRYFGLEKGAPTWIRVHFIVTCGSCGEALHESTQTNLTRPWTCICACGAALYDDLQSPVLGWSALN